MGVTLAVIVTLLGTGNPAAPPEARVLPTEFLSWEKCQEWKAEKEKSPPELVDKASGKPVMAVFYSCTPWHSKFLNPSLDQAMKENPD